MKKNIENNQERQKQQYRKRKEAVSNSIQVGQTVLRLNILKRTTKGHKMEDTWLGPYRVIEMFASGGCVLRCIKTNSTIKRKVNISQLKIYNTPQKSLNWLMRQAKMMNQLLLGLRATASQISQI